MTRTTRFALPAILLLASVAFSGCFRRTFVIVPHRDGGYGARDTLYGQRAGETVRVVFRHDTLWRVDTVTRTDTLWRGGTRIIRDTVRVPMAVTPTAPSVPTTTTPPGGTVVPRATPPVRRDTVYLPDPRRARDTVYLPRPGAGRVDTLRIVVRDTIRTGGRDTVRITVRDTLRVVVRDTLRIVSRDTLRVVVRDTVLVGGGRRLVFVPPGLFPPAGQCRVWIHDRPPGQQARSQPCALLGPVPAGAFVLFDGVAWDVDHDWVAESRRASVPPEILALRRAGAP